MNVEELINRLKKLDPESEVKILKRGEGRWALLETAHNITSVKPCEYNSTIVLINSES
jgi:hypothetical protein